VFAEGRLLELQPKHVRYVPENASGIKTPGTRARHVCYQIQALHVCKLADPIVSLPLGFFRLHPLVQPESEVAELNRQFGKGRLQSPGKSFVESKKLRIHQIIGNEIRDEVMECHHDCMVVFSDAEKNSSNQR